MTQPANGAVLFYGETPMTHGVEQVYMIVTGRFIMFWDGCVFDGLITLHNEKTIVG
jgi:hypothetical protein